MRRTISTLQRRDRPRVLLVAGESWVGFARVPRLFSDAGCHVGLLCHPSYWAAQSGYVDELLPAPRGASATLDALEPLVATQEFDWVILGDDPILRAAVERPAVAQSPWFPVDGSGGKPRMLISKTAFSQLAVRAQLPFPPSEATLGEHATAAAKRLGFPVIVKPEFGSGGHGIVRADEPADLGQLQPGAPVLVQRFVDGRIGSTEVLFSSGRPLCWMSSYKEGVHPKPFGPSCVRRYVCIPGLEDHLRQLGSALGLTGLCAVDWVQPCAAETPLLIELNARPTPCLHLHRQYGVDFPGAIRAMLAGSPRVVRPPQTVERPLVRMFPQHAIAAVSEDDWLGFARGLLSGEDRPDDDPRLLRSLRRELLRQARAVVARYPRRLSRRAARSMGLRRPILA
jgi:hypothetical protein